ncbi:DJ-1 family glyoxalase III [Gallibacterium anatis]|uniref:DJ-1 family glyoxalase III n=1 Tax=Gallibacterium anatis TaxID=750 RepID=UPI0039FD4DCA
MTQKIAILLTKGFEDAEALVPNDLFRRAGLHTDLISIDNTEIVSSSHNVKVVADQLLNQTDLNSYDLVMLPGGQVDLEKYAALADTYRQFAQQQKWVAAICAAPTALAKVGLLKGKNAVCYPSMRADLINNEVNYRHLAAVIDAPFITGRGPGAAFDFGLAIVAQLLGVDAAEQLKQQLYY